MCCTNFSFWGSIFYFRGDDARGGRLSFKFLHICVESTVKNSTRIFRFIFILIFLLGVQFPFCLFPIKIVPHTGDDSADKNIDHTVFICLPDGEIQKFTLDYSNAINMI